MLRESVLLDGKEFLPSTHSTTRKIRRLGQLIATLGLSTYLAACGQPPTFVPGSEYARQTAEAMPKGQEISLLKGEVFTEEQIRQIRASSIQLAISSSEDPETQICSATVIAIKGVKIWMITAKHCFDAWTNDENNTIIPGAGLAMRTTSRKKLTPVTISNMFYEPGRTSSDTIGIEVDLGSDTVMPRGIVPLGWEYITAEQQFSNIDAILLTGLPLVKPIFEVTEIANPAELGLRKDTKVIIPHAPYHSYVLRDAPLVYASSSPATSGGGVYTSIDGKFTLDGVRSSENAATENDGKIAQSAQTFISPIPNQILQDMLTSYNTTP